MKCIIFSVRDIIDNIKLSMLMLGISNIKIKLLLFIFSFLYNFHFYFFSCFLNLNLNKKYIKKKTIWKSNGCHVKWNEISHLAIRNHIILKEKRFPSIYRRLFKWQWFIFSTNTKNGNSGNKFWRKEMVLKVLPWQKVVLFHSRAKIPNE